MSSSTAGIYLLSPDHAEAIQRLAADPAVAATTRIPHPYPPNGAETFITAQLAARLEGTAYTFAVMDRKVLVGVCGLEGVGQGQARELGFWIGREHWGKGYATFAVSMLLQFAFQNLALDRVSAVALETNAASRRVLEKNGFELIEVVPHQDPGLKRPDERVAVYRITPLWWAESRNGPVLAGLHPALKSLLEGELAAGNEVLETGRGWPDADSLFVRLRHPFRSRPANLPEGVTYTEPNDPHWWKADYSSKSPRHILAC